MYQLLEVMRDYKTINKCLPGNSEYWVKKFEEAYEADNKSIPMQLPVKPANGGQIYLLYKRLLGYSDMTPILVAVFDDVEKALDKKYQLQKDDHANSYFIEDSRLSV